MAPILLPYRIRCLGLSITRPGPAAAASPPMLPVSICFTNISGIRHCSVAFVGNVVNTERTLELIKPSVMD